MAPTFPNVPEILEAIAEALLLIVSEKAENFDVTASILSGAAKDSTMPETFELTSLVSDENFELTPLVNVENCELTPLVNVET